MIDGDERDELQFERLVQKRKQVYQALTQNKEQAHNETREIPLQLLALEWFNQIDASIETRAYLVENFLPILVLGCEKVLKDAQNKDLVEQNKKDVNFNPINLLGQFLMRNNPKYNNHNETSAYVRTLREVYHQLREQMFAFQENKLAKVKADIRQRRADRENQMKSKQTEINRRSEKLDDIFAKWHVCASGRIEIAVVMEALNLYKDHISRMPAETRKASQVNMSCLPSYCYTRDGMNMTKRVIKSEFLECMLSITDNMSSEYFDLFIEFMRECTSYFIVQANRTRLNKILKSLFQLVDTTGCGLLTRRRVISLLNEFTKTQASPAMKTHFKNPMEFPMLDPLLKFENKLATKQSREDQGDYVEVASVINEAKQELPDVDSAAAAAADDSAPTAEVAQPAAAAVEINEAKAEDEEDMEGGDETDRLPGELGDDAANQINAKSELAAHFAVSDAEDEDEDNYVPVKSVISKENELLFLNGGILYYKPLEEALNAFDRNLIQEKKRPRSATKSAQTANCQLTFDNEFVDSKQFLNIMSAYIEAGVFDDEKTVNDLVVFLKDNYAENQREKNNKLEKQAFEKKYKAQRDRIAAAFEKIDNEGSGSISFDYIVNSLLAFKEGMFKDQVEKATDALKAKIRYTGRADEVVFKDEFIEYVMHLIKMADFAKFEDQVMNYLNGLVMPSNKMKARGESRKMWLAQIEQVGALTFGSFEPLYKQLFVTLAKDQEAHGLKKKISAYVGILETLGNQKVALKYHASTPHDSKYILNQTLTRETPNVTYQAIDENRVVLVKEVKECQSVHYFNTDYHKDGALYIHPMRYSRHKIFGTIGIDTLQEEVPPTIGHKMFMDHELEFFKGVVSTFSSAYANVVFKNRMAKLLKIAIEWLNARSQCVEEANVYVVQVMNGQAQLLGDATAASDKDSVNSAVFNTDAKEDQLKLKPVYKYSFCNNVLIDNLASFEDEAEKQIRPNLYECAMTSECTTDKFNCKTSQCFPIRNEKNKTAFVVELISDSTTTNAIKEELSLVETVIYVLDLCKSELLAEYFLGITSNQYDFENKLPHEKFEILFEKKYLKLILEKLRNAQDQNQKLVELLPDGSESPEVSKTKNLFKLFAEVICSPEFLASETLTDTVVDKMAAFDSTPDGFYFKPAPKSNMDLLDEACVKELHKHYAQLGSKNEAIRLLVDWLLLQASMMKRAVQVKEILGK